MIADEAHRSQYDLIDGLARNMRDALPNASFIGFTGTPIEKTDANTRAVFGDYICIYDIQRAVADKATVPIYYESRIAKLGLNAAELPKLDEEFEEITEGEEQTRKEKLKTKWAALEALVGDPKRIALIAADLVTHFEKRAGGDGRQGDDRLHEPPHLRGPLQRAHRAAPGLGQRQGRRRRSREGQGLRGEGRDDRQRRRRPRLAAAHPQQGQAPPAGQPLQGQPRTRSAS